MSSDLVLDHCDLNCYLLSVEGLADGEYELLNEVYFNRWRNVQLKNPTDPKLAALDKQIAYFEMQINALRKPIVHHLFYLC